ncbi:VPLPA-CTERM sorting domain-containing protein [Thiobaca trueperi]|uniref:Putative secreted protein n=1 Tax=Thiobaca trueperi TaxID=127458 RepID=A0A4R3MTB1_9GAMM|nr:VPLPA-CTERM sorting domain-containing protein [Thiobaca trueperi]TCT19235.1 putative secreted protein [Thiobaca trueperi]
MNKIFSSLIGGLALLAVSFGANAATINGQVQITGGMQTIGTYPSATGVNFLYGEVGSWLPSNATGDLSVMLGATTANGQLQMPSFSFADPSGTTIWSFVKGGDNFTFKTDTIDSKQENGYLSVTAYGFLSSTNSNYDTTNAIFQFSTQLGKNEVTATFSSGTAVVPLPAAAWLFGSALLGLVGIARRRQSSPV